ncbi:protein phosphatase 2C domain-containing protein [Herbidospora mongoliensis]|uniref:protein phosphatase 2C domain-containing protein n=1 Tax=Herbidospora mongoliensis TaxID=688067 RepID=UPI000831025B|nr:protein phosphatase 2C domain-containing protein [Herbidospora mongoliensis]
MTFEPPVVYGTPHAKAGIPMGLPGRPDAVPDSVIDGADLPGVTVRAASLRGDDHRFYGTTRQDAMGLWLLGPDVLLVCVADGVGSQPEAHLGSALACRSLYEEAEPVARRLLDPDEDTAGEIADGIAQRMLAAIAADPVTYATTLTAAVVELTPSGEPRHCVVFAVGDSPALLLRDGEFTSLLDTDADTDGDIVDGRTAALPLHPGTVRTATVELGADDALVVCTDGLTGPMHDEKVRAQLAEWWRRPVPGLLEFGWQLAFRAKSHTDDRTAVCVWGS